MTAVFAPRQLLMQVMDRSPNVAMTGNLIKRGKTSKVGVKIKRLKASWNNDYLLRVIATI